MAEEWITIGILAWNEQDSIETTLEGVFAQSLLQEKACRQVEIVVVANGCTDQTAVVARKVLQDLATASCAGRVVELKEPGKINAWNVLVHRESRPETGIFILADADIRFLGDRTLENMIMVLEQDSSVVASTDEPVKHIALKADPSWTEKISLKISGMTKAAPGQLTGQLYAARADTLRRIVMPKGLIVEDGFLKQFLCTNGYREAVDNSRICRAPEAAHVFEAYLTIKDILPNQRRQAMGHTIYTYLRDYLKSESEKGRDAEVVLKEEDARSADWFLVEIRRRVTEGGWWVMHEGALSVRWKRLLGLPVGRRFSAFPAALIGWLMDLIVYVWANRTLKRGTTQGIWKDTRTERLTNI